MRKLKILYTIPNFDTAGSGKVVYDLAKNLDKNKFDVHIACSHNRGEFFLEVQKLGVPIHLIETTCSLKPYWSLIGRLRNYKDFVCKNEFDIVHSWHWSSDWTEVLSAKWGGAKFIFTKKAMTWGNIHWKLRSFFSDFIITINDEMENYFLYKKQQKLIPLGLDTNFYNPILFENRSVKKVFKIITVANLVKVKGVEILIDAFLKLNNDYVELYIVGDDRSEYATFLKQKASNSIRNKQIYFIGKQADVRKILAESDLYVIPSEKEGMPMALVEAMAMGVPVLGSNISGINFVLKDFPEYMFEVSNVDTLSMKIDEMYRKTLDERNVIGVKLREYCVKNFSLDKFIQAHEELYFNLIKKK